MSTTPSTTRPDPGPDRDGRAPATPPTIVELRFAEPLRTSLTLADWRRRRTLARLRDAGLSDRTIWQILPEVWLRQAGARADRPA